MNQRFPLAARPQERAKCMHTPGRLEHLGSGVEQRAEGASAAIVDEHLRSPEYAAYLFVRGRDLFRDRRVAP